VFLAGVRDACAREIAYLRAHPWDLALISWFPALVMALAWAIFAQGVNVKLPLALVDEDHSPGSRHLAIALDAVRSIMIAERPSTLEEAWPLVRERRVYAVLHVPIDWERRAQRGDPLPIVLYTNEQYHAAASSIASDVLGAIASVAGGRARTALAGLGGGFAGAELRADSVRVELRTLYGPRSQVLFCRRYGTCSRWAVPRTRSDASFATGPRAPGSSRRTATSLRRSSGSSRLS